MASGAEPIYFIHDMVSDDATATELKQKYGQIGEYNLISTSKLAEKNLTGSIRFIFDIDDFDAIRGKTLAINNGDEAIARIKVDSPEMTVDLPAGVYKVAPPIADNNYDFDRLYILVTADAVNDCVIRY